MRLIVQRVKKAQVTEVKTGEVVGEIGEGLFVLLGVTHTDTLDTAKTMALKVSKMRLMSDSNDKMNLSVLDSKSSILVVSQFTLYANTKDGNRPSFLDAATPSLAAEIYEEFIDSLIKLNIHVEKGSFGNYMKIDTTLDGPVTILLDA